jgi:hypothetical protein
VPQPTRRPNETMIVTWLCIPTSMNQNTIEIIFQIHTLHKKKMGVGNA